VASEAPTGGESAAPSDGGGNGEAVEISAVNIKFEQTEVSAPADAPFTIRFDNKEAVPHNVEIKDAAGMSLFKGEIVTGPVVVDYAVPALAAGTYQFVCTVHPNMIGTLVVGG
jgi:plastocyanin